MSWYIHTSKQLREDELPPELVVTNRDGSIKQVYVPYNASNQLESENTKLRELVRDYDKVLDAAVDVWGIMADALGYGRKYDALHDRMRELGIEVDG